jgi:hypothetical protein
LQTVIKVVLQVYLKILSVWWGPNHYIFTRYSKKCTDQNRPSSEFQDACACSGPDMPLL